MPSVASPTTNVFDTFVDSYEDACDRGLHLSGESRDYFARSRVALTRELCSTRVVRSIVDFGCGLGHTTPHLLESFSEAHLVGVDTADEAIRAARERYGSARAGFRRGDTLSPGLPVDLVYTNGVFHHIEPADRRSQVETIFLWLDDGGRLAFWENNPWNPGTRLIMRRIPFDRDARPLSYLEAQDLLRAAGFQLLQTSFHFFFPSWLSWLRRWEFALQRVPFGAQYCVLAEKRPS